MIKAHDRCRELSAIVHRIDWVLSGDDGEDSYFNSLAEDMKTIEFDDPSQDEKWAGIPTFYESIAMQLR
jgi:hypothetical protein